MQVARKRLRQFLPWLCIVVGACLLVISVILYEGRPKAPANAVHIAVQPSTKKPSNAQIAQYSVAPNLPKYISIPVIGVNNSRVIKLGQLQNSQIATPSNIYDAGWYQQSATPGQTGAMFIFGHVSSWTAQGIFYNLHKLRGGDAIRIVRGDNAVFTYKVVTAKTYPYNAVDMSAVLSPIRPGSQALNLMTCTGKIIPGTSDFSQRLVIFAVRV